jgi:hypothetical protein
MYVFMTCVCVCVCAIIITGARVGANLGAGGIINGFDF